MAIKNRHILLLLDNFSGHILEKEQFSNVNLKFLPPNTTSFLQPLDQGIINNFKLNYKHLFIRRYIHEIEEYQEAFIPDVKQAILLSIQAIILIKASTIVSCWIKAGIIDNSEVTANNCIVPQNIQLKESIKLYFDKFKFETNEQKVQNIENFLDISNNNDSMEELTDSQIVNIVEAREHVEEESSLKEHSSENQLVLPLASDILKSFKQIKLYCEHQKQTQSEHLDVVNQLEDIIMNFVHLNMRQKPIDSYLIKNLAFVYIILINFVLIRNFMSFWFFLPFFHFIEKSEKLNSEHFFCSRVIRIKEQSLYL
jgi:hypothetical protein